jgi:two-component system response regulator DevR
VSLWGPVRIFIVDDHELVRLGLRAVLGQNPEFEIAGEAGSVAAAVEGVALERPDLVLLDIRLPDGSGYEACRQIRQLHSSTKILILTSFSDDEVVFKSLSSGADGVLLKEIDSEALMAGIRDVAAGRSLLCRDLAPSPDSRTPIPEGSVKGRETPRQGLQMLSNQEGKVIALVAEGKTNKEIATVLGLSDKTVKNYFSNILEKLGMTRRSQAAAFYARRNR